MTPYTQTTTRRSSTKTPLQRVPELAIVVPCFNEQDVLPETASRLRDLLTELLVAGEVTDGSGIYFVDDGSTDGTWQIIEDLAADDDRLHGIKLSRNHGHQNALIAGLMTAPGDAIVSIDADLQDDPNAIRDMVAAYRGGAEVVYGIRRERKVDTFFKRTSAEAYYRLLHLMGVQVVFNHADYRLLGRRVLDVLRECKEANLFLRGLIPQLGFNTAAVYYDRHQRFAGETKYPLRKMLALAVDGITSFSAVPLKLITVLGMLISIVSMTMGVWAFWAKLHRLGVVPGWASTVVPIYMLGGIQLLCTGIIGQYVAKVYSETKKRPRFIVEKTL